MARLLALRLRTFAAPSPCAGSWWIIDEPELHFGDDVLVPDLAGWRRKRMPQFPINAETRTLEVYRRSEDRWLVLATYESDALVRAEPFAAPLGRDQAAGAYGRMIVPSRRRVRPQL